MPEFTPLRVLIVDDEPLITIFIKRIVAAAGHHIADICYDSDHALRAIKGCRPDLIFMDINIKGSLDGISVVKKAGPIEAMLYYISAYSSDEIIEEALGTHPYNYLFKPIKEVEVKTALELCRMRLLAPTTEAQHRIRLADALYFDLHLGVLEFEASPVALTRTEQKLIRVFAENINILLSYEYLREAVWEQKSIADSTLRDHVSKLRQKFPQLNIYTNFGEGYKLIVTS